MYLIVFNNETHLHLTIMEQFSWSALVACSHGTTSVHVAFYIRIPAISKSKTNVAMEANNYRTLKPVLALWHKVLSINWLSGTSSSAFIEHHITMSQAIYC